MPGAGERKIDMNFLPDLHITCSDCRGSRFNRQTLEIRYRNLSIADVLNLQIEAAADFFEISIPFNGRSSISNRSDSGT